MDYSNNSNNQQQWQMYFKDDASIAFLQKSNNLQCTFAFLLQIGRRSS